MKNLIKFEEFAQFIFGIYLFSFLNMEWWWFFLLILTPDLGMLGYVFSNRVGAWSYNFFHHKGIAILIYLAGVFLEVELLELAGVILFAHSAFDRMLGYGLKYEKGFKFTHLGNL